MLSQPTAPFYEGRVIAHLETEAARLGVRCRRDRHGNVLWEYRKGRATTPVAFTAHMDHPGLEVVAGGARDALALWHGQAPPFPLDGQRVAIYRGVEGLKVRGRIIGPVERSDIDAARAFPIAVSSPVAPGDFGHFDLVPFRLARWRRGELAVTKGADNLGGCAAIVLLFEMLQQERPAAHVTGVFTRAEEVGFYGALGIVKERALAKGTWVIVLETSKALPMAEIGLGPVIRVGDRARIFDSDLLYAMKRVADDLARSDPAFRYQMRVMDGGTCEATPYVLQGYKAAGIAFPLGNYHNVGRTGVRPEHISVEDVVCGLALMRDLALRSGELAGLIAAQKSAIFGKLDEKLARLRSVPLPPPPSQR
ncbi:MAG: M28 family peptidase [Acidobacteriota bacterium]